MEELINSCRLLPGKLTEENERQRRGGHITSENPYLHKLGVWLGFIRFFSFTMNISVRFACLILLSCRMQMQCLVDDFAA